MVVDVLAIVVVVITIRSTVVVVVRVICDRPRLSAAVRRGRYIRNDADYARPSSGVRISNHVQGGASVVHCSTGRRIQGKEISWEIKVREGVVVTKHTLLIIDCSLRDSIFYRHDTGSQFHQSFI